MNFKNLAFYVFMHHFLIPWCCGLRISGNKGFENYEEKSLGNDKNEDVNKENLIDALIKPSQLNYNNDLFTSKISNDTDIRQLYSKFASVSESGIRKKSADKKAFLRSIKIQIYKEGCLKIKSLADTMKNEMKLKSDFSEITNNVIDDFADELNTYFRFIETCPVKHEIDWEFYFLDIIESSNKVFAAKTKNLFDRIMATIDIEQCVDVDFILLRESVEKAVASEKKLSLKYICKNFDICRPYPAYSDHIAELLRTILQLSDKKCNIIYELTKENIKMRPNFFYSIMKEEIANKTGAQLISIQNTSLKREIFLVIREVIAQRYIMFKTNKTKIDKRTKAVKLLIDMMDKTFEKLGNDFNDFKFFKVKKGLNDWAVNEIKHVETVVGFLLKDIINVLNINWFPKTKEEVKELITFIITGSSDNKTILDELLTRGPKFMRDDTMMLNLNNMLNFI